MHDESPFAVRTTVYVRQEHALVLASVLPRVGGPRPPLWGDGWRLALGARAMAEVPWDSRWSAVNRLLASGLDAYPMTPEQRASWMRSWRHAG